MGTCAKLAVHWPKVGVAVAERGEAVGGGAVTLARGVQQEAVLDGDARVAFLLRCDVLVLPVPVYDIYNGMARGMQQAHDHVK